MGELDRDLCLFWKSVAAANITFPTSAIISFEFLEDQLEAHIGEIAPQGPAPPEALPAPQRKKLILRKPERKTPQVVQEDEEEDDEATEDGLVTKRKRVAPSSPPTLPTPTPPSPPAPTPPVQAVPLAAALPTVEGNKPNFLENPHRASTPFVSAGEGPPSTASIAEAAPGGDEGAHNSPILITESPSSPPRQETQPHQPIQEGGGESQHQASSAPPPTAAASLPLAVREIWGPFTAKLKMTAEDLPSIITRAVESSSKKLQGDISTLQEENRLIRIEAEKLSCNLMMAEIDHLRVEDAMSVELRVARKEASDLRRSCIS
ncbi:vegetative cell wall protein gp1-like [Phaseolus vulgaris]|uniref:vegetative cell wall protein gp1-like n=1 Tax=Phaseolus vulgaris TaxID=3885 RepID=UPI0035CB25D5